MKRYKHFLKPGDSPEAFFEVKADKIALHFLFILRI